MKIMRCTEDSRNWDRLDPDCVGPVIDEGLEEDHEAGEDFCLPVDPPCKSTEVINEWLDNKKVMLKVIQYKIDFKLIGADTYTRQNEIWLDSIPMENGKYSDVGYRFRKNFFEFLDSIHG